MSFKILDCTLRDGGYYTDWKFNPKLVKLLVKTLDSNGVDIIELGYKSPVIGGHYRKCNDGFISSSGKFVREFEKKFAKRLNRKFAISVSNGTAALQLAFESLNIKSVSLAPSLMSKLS